MQFGGVYGPILGSGSNTVVNRSPGFCAQIAEIEVDEQTGEVQVHKLVVIQDVGKAINPLTIEGQMMGGAVQGMGWALYEQMQYDEYGQPLTASWMDYNLPHFTQIAGNIGDCPLWKCRAIMALWVPRVSASRQLFRQPQPSAMH